MTLKFKGLIVIVFLLGVNVMFSSCESYKSPEEKGYHYTKTKFEDIKTIIKIAERREVVGYLEQESIVLKGYKEERDNFYVYNKEFNRVGMITQGGKTFRLYKDGLLFIGTYLLDEGIKAILNISGNIVFEEYNVRARP